MYYVLRRSLLTQEYAPESILPPTHILAQRFNTSEDSIIQACEKLVQDAYLQPLDDTRISVSPVNHDTTHIAVVFPLGYTGYQRSRFHTTLIEQCAQVEQEQPIHFSMFYGVYEAEDLVGYDALLSGIRTKAFDSIIFPTGLGDWYESLYDTGLRIPAVHISAVPFWKAPQDPTIRLRGDLLLERALHRSKECGCRAVSVLGYGQTDPEKEHRLMGMLNAQDLHTSPLWLHDMCTCSHEHIGEVVRLMFLGTHGVPDCIVVTDDNLLPGVIMGLQRSEQTIGTDVQVVSHCNYPLETRLAGDANVIYLGFDLAHVLRRCLQLLQDSSGRDIVEEVEPRFQEEQATAPVCKKLT